MKVLAAGRMVEAEPSVLTHVSWYVHRTMRATHVCPKCQGRKLYVIDPVRMPDRENNLFTIPISYGIVNHARVEIGRLESWLCATCGYVEYYAKDATKALAALAAQPHGNVRYLDGSGSTGGAFR